MQKTFIAAALPLVALLHAPAPAQAAPRGDAPQPGGAQATIDRLKAQGMVVRVNRIGDAPMDECQVSNVGTLSSARQMIPIFDSDDVNVFSQQSKQKVTVTLNCAG